LTDTYIAAKFVNLQNNSVVAEFLIGQCYPNTWSFYANINWKYFFSVNEEHDKNYPHYYYVEI